MSRASFGKGSPRRDAEFHARRHERHMEKLGDPTLPVWHGGEPHVNEEKRKKKLARQLAKAAAAEEARLMRLRDQSEFGAW